MKVRVDLPGVAQWVERWPANPRATGSIPSQGPCLGCGPGPQWGAHERQPHLSVSLPFFSPSFLLCLKINKILKKKENEGNFRVKIVSIGFISHSHGH